MQINPETAKKAFKERIESADKTISSLTLPEGIAAMTSYYKEVRMDGCALADDEDIVLFHWGSFHGGVEDCFEIAVARQLIIDGDTANEAIWQLTLSFEFPPTEAFEALDSRQEWCYTPDALDEFESFIYDSEVFKAATSMPPQKVELLYECVG
jgi:hypothetical protein